MAAPKGAAIAVYVMLTQKTAFVLKEKRRRERYTVRDDVVDLIEFEPTPPTMRKGIYAFFA